MIDLLKLAVTAAGGPQKVGEVLGVSTWTVNKWVRAGQMPAEHVRDLVQAGQGFVPERELAAYLVDRAYQRKRDEQRRALTGSAA